MSEQPRTSEETERMIGLLESPNVAPGHLGRAALQRVLGGEAPGDEAAHAQGCPHCRPRLEALRATRDAFLVRHPPAAFMAALEARRPEAWWRRWPTWIGAGLLAAAAAAVALSVQPVSPAPEVAAGTRLKAGVGLSFHVRGPQGVRDGEPGAVLQPGDAIQLRYSTPAHRHLVVVSLDSAGAVTPFYDQGGRSLAIEPGVGRLLEGSVLLDDALGPERVVGCFSEAPLPTADVVAAAKAALAQAGGDPTRVERLPLDCTQASFTFVKAPR
ncbi:MAG: hypothetical protein H6702_20900 [Myxococcales bacterium]|nr:hypothetical protein [Myxococcales bacterium]